MATQIHHTLCKRGDTSDATPLNLVTFTPVADRAAHVRAKIIAYTAAGTSRAWTLERPLKRFGGATSLVGNLVDLLAGNGGDVGAATWAATFALSGNDVTLQVTGQAATAIKWVAWMEFFYIGEE